jgi:hypothetical protein
VAWLAGPRACAVRRADAPNQCWGASGASLCATCVLQQLCLVELVQRR